MKEGNTERNQQLRLVAAAAHDLKTPLSYIRSAAASMRQGLVPAEDFPGHITRIEQSAARLLHVVDGVLGAAYADQQQFQLPLEPVDALQVIRQAVDDVEPYARELGHRFKLSHTRTLPPVFANRLGLRRVIFNLLDNAVRYSKDGQDIELKARCRDRRVQIVVRDFGIGVKKQDMKQIFELFGRAANPTQAVPSGSGLGLFIASELAEAMAADLSVRPLREGTAFQLSVPVAEQLALF